MPATLTLLTSIYGAAYGLFPIGWIIINAIFIYNLSVETGQFAGSAKTSVGRFA